MAFKLIPLGTVVLTQFTAKAGLDLVYLEGMVVQAALRIKFFIAVITSQDLASQVPLFPM